jgi:hypothetical protein
MEHHPQQPEPLSSGDMAISCLASGVTVIIKMQIRANFSDLVGTMNLSTAFALI